MPSSISSLTSTIWNKSQKMDKKTRDKSHEHGTEWSKPHAKHIMYLAIMKDEQLAIYHNFIGHW